MKSILMLTLVLLLITLSNCQQQQGRGQKRGHQKQDHQNNGQKRGQEKDHQKQGPKKPHPHGQSKEYLEWVKQNKKKSWKEGKNFDENISVNQLQKLGGSVRRRPHGNRGRVFSAPPETKPATLQLPLNFDARIQWPNCPSISEVSDQGSCGSCWAIAPADVMTDRTCILSGGRVWNFRYSVEDLLTCCTDCGYGCNGGDPYVSYEYWINQGIVSGGHHNTNQGCLQYSIPPCEHRITTSSLPICDENNVTTPECRRACESTYPIPYQNDLAKGEKAYNITSVEDAMYELVIKGPISSTMLVYQDFFSYKSGVYQETPGASFLGRHAIRIIGYGEETGIPYWLCVNSWNTAWGDNGIFKIRKGSNECSIEDELMAGLPKF